jgi:hypothetical protein
MFNAKFLVPHSGQQALLNSRAKLPTLHPN